MDIDKRYDWFNILEIEELNPYIEQLANASIVYYAKGCVSTRGVNRNKRDQEIRLIAQHLISALYSAYTASSQNKLWVSIPLRALAYGKPKGHYNDKKIAYSYRYAKAVIDCLLSTSWVEITKEVVQKHQRLIYPTAQLLEVFEKIGFRWYKVHSKPLHSLVVLKDVKRDSKGKVLRNKKYKTTKINLPVEYSPFVEETSQILYQLNSELTEHCISLALSDQELMELEQKQADKTKVERRYIDFYQTQLVRIFARGSMKKGGRLYRVWWQNMLSEYRKYLYIDGEPTVEVDYSAMSIRLLYAKHELPYPLEKDPYDIGLPNWEGRKDIRRKPIKRFINAILNDEDGIYTLKSSDKKLLGGISDTQLRLLVEKAHPEIYSKMLAGTGLELQYLDSLLALNILRMLQQRKIVVLPIHDSFVAQAKYAYELQQMMSDSFQFYLDFPILPDMTVDYGVVRSIPSHSKMALFLESWRNNTETI